MIPRLTTPLFTALLPTRPLKRRSTSWGRRGLRGPRFSDSLHQARCAISTDSCTNPTEEPLLFDIKMAPRAAGTSTLAKIQPTGGCMTNKNDPWWPWSKLHMFDLRSPSNGGPFRCVRCVLHKQEPCGTMRGATWCHKPAGRGKGALHSAPWTCWAALGAIFS